MRGCLFAYLFNKVYLHKKIAMTIKITPTIDQFMFVSDMAILRIAMDPQTEFELRIICGSNQIFAANYITDEQGEVVILDLDRVFEFYTTALPTAYTLRIVVGPTSYSYPLKMFKSRIYVADTGTAYINGFFLSPVHGERDTMAGRVEMLTAYLPTATGIETYCTYYKDGKAWEELWGGANDKGLYNFVIKPADLLRDGAKLVAIRLAVGNRQMRYRVLDYAPEATVAFVYRNCFDVMETIYFNGTREVTPSYTRSTSYINGIFTNYKVEDEMIYKINSGVMRSTMEQALLDLARSQEVYLLNADGSQGMPVVITDCDVKHSDADDELLEATYTYRLGQRYNSVLKAQHRAKVFDTSFDATYE